MICLHAASTRSDVMGNSGPSSRNGSESEAAFSVLSHPLTTRAPWKAKPYSSFPGDPLPRTLCPSASGPLPNTGRLAALGAQSTGSKSVSEAPSDEAGRMPLSERAEKPKVLPVN